jgi:hypothetical protein
MDGYEWQDMAAPEVEQFLSTIQKYVNSKGTYDPVEGTPSWIFLELFRPSIKTAFDRAEAYHARIRKHVQRIFDKSGVNAAVASGKEQTARMGSAQAAGIKEKRFQVALSFPGENRVFVEKVADYLASELGRDRVLYDKFHEAEFARPNLDTHLQGLYHDESTLVVIFLSADYAQKEWCGLELRAIRDLIKKGNAKAIMPLRFDNCVIPGLFSIDGYVSIETRSALEIAALILKRLKA